MTASQIVIGLLIGGAAGLLAGVLGLGGGIIIPPLISLLLGFPQHVAQAASLAALLPPVGFPALLGYRRQGVRVRSTLVLWLIGSFAIAGALGGLIAHQVPDRPLKWAFSGVLVVIFVRTMTPVFFPRAALEPTASVAPPRAGAWPAIAIGTLGGLASGLFGIGGGALILPMLMRWARLSRLEAQATTIAMMLAPIGLPAVFVYATSSPLPWPLIIAVAAGFSVGALVGGRLAPKLSERFATSLFGVVLIVSALAMLLKA